jgi:hypothetical protein
MLLRKISDYLKINGVNMPTPDGDAKIEYTPLWSENSGRGASGYYVGDIVSEKRKVIFEFSGLNEELINLINSHLTTFFTIDFVNPFDHTKRMVVECYKPPRSFTLKQIDRFGTFSLSCIER